MTIECEEFRAKDPVLANVIAELIGNSNGVEYYRGFKRALEILSSDISIGINRTKEYASFCEWKLQQPEDAAARDPAPAFLKGEKHGKH